MIARSPIRPCRVRGTSRIPDYYRRDGSTGLESLLTAADLSHTSLGPDQFELRLVAATPDLAHAVLSTCAALTADATEVIASGGCDAAEQNVYEWSEGGLSLINALPGEGVGSLLPAEIAAPSGATSRDGSRVYFPSEGNVYLNDGGITRAVRRAGRQVRSRFRRWLDRVPDRLGAVGALLDRHRDPRSAHHRE